MEKTSVISFPGFGIGNFEVNSVAFSIGDFAIAWYAIIITFGMIAACFYTWYKGKNIGLTSEDIIDYALALIPSGIVGARLYYVLSEIEHYKTFADVIDIRSGGMAIYGGIIAGFIAAVIVTKVKKISFTAFADCCAPGIILAQSIGRWGNFMNGEAYGAQTDIFCRMGLSNINTRLDFSTSEMVYVHPTFLYESLWNLLGFVLINLFFKHKKYDGQILLLTFGWYGLGRMLIEGLRTDSLYTKLFGGAITFRTSQVLAGLIFAACLGLLIYFAIKKPKKEFFKKTTEK